MFNWVIVPDEVKCKACGFDMGGTKGGWQTKMCRHDLTCETIPYIDCDEFYAPCPKCNVWNEYERIQANSLADFKLSSRE